MRPDWKPNESLCKSLSRPLLGYKLTENRPINMYMVHFRTHDLDTLFSQGHFWHLNFLTGALLINQDEKEIFTFHKMVGPDTKAEDLDPMEVLVGGLGGIGTPCPVKVDKILKTATWKSSLSIADAFSSAKGRVFLAGDSGASS